MISMKIVILIACLLVLICSSGDCMRARKTGRKTVKEPTATRRTRRDQHPEHSPPKNDMKKYFVDQLSPHLDELEDNCVQRCIQEQEKSEKEEIVMNQQSTETDDDDDRIEEIADELLAQYAASTEGRESVDELNQNKAEHSSISPSANENTKHHSEKTVHHHHKKHESAATPKTPNDVHETDHSQMEHGKGRKEDKLHHSYQPHAHHSYTDHHDQATKADHHDGANDDDDDDHHETHDKASEKPPPSPTSLFTWVVSFVVFLATVTIVALRSEEVHHGH